jgi:2-polyprenyl-3-methyl-5-hydroxy-6-metoxy-1,4-benzoquinol methylase
VTHPYELTPRVDVYAELPARFDSILDVGCSRGGFCEYVKGRHPATTVWGIEPDEGAAMEARPRADRVVIGRFPDDLPADAPKFDVIVFADVLEHLTDPQSALEAASARLAPQGVVVASIPNIRHWRVIKKIAIDGDFTYTDTGILDRTHLRFFTKSTMRALFEDSGFSVARCTPTDLSRHPLFRGLRRLAPEVGHELTATQFILTGMPGTKG